MIIVLFATDEAVLSMYSINKMIVAAFWILFILFLILISWIMDNLYSISISIMLIYVILYLLHQKQVRNYIFDYILYSLLMTTIILFCDIISCSITFIHGLFHIHLETEIIVVVILVHLMKYLINQ